MARVVRPTAYGTPEVLEVQEVQVPRASKGQLVVRLRAIGVNPLDWKLYSGSFHDVDDEHANVAGSDTRMPEIGLEGAGVVTEVGAGVDGVRVGDEVIVFPAPNAYADYVVVAEDAAIAKPAELGWAEAAGLILAGTTAAHALHAADVKAGDTVIVHGGSGAVGLIAVQLAVAEGATVIATASGRNHALLRQLGAIPVAYGEGLLERLRAVAPDGADAAIDAVGTEEALDTSLALVGAPDRIVSIEGGPRRAEAGIRRLGYGPGEDAGFAFRAAARAPLAARAATGELRVIIAGTYSLDQAIAAHEAGLAGHKPGKLVLLP